jgi:hypothetical protein
MQIWSRLTREAQAEKERVPVELRPKFYVEKAKEERKPTAAETTTTSAEASLAAHLATAATSHITSKLASSFWSAFSSSGTGAGAGLDNDKLTAVVTGQAKLSVIPSSSEQHFCEKTASSSTSVLNDESLASLMGGLKLHMAPAPVSRGVRENPLGAFSQFMKAASCPGSARA